MKNIIIILFVVLLSKFSLAEVKVVASTTVIYDLVKQIGKDKVKTDYIARGDQDPHFVEVLPSYMLKLRKADIFFRIGMGLEMWSNQLVDGSRNNHLKVIDLSTNIDKKEVPTTKIDASYGDVHPYGNPHYWLDPENAKIMAKEICDALSAESPDDASYFNSNLDAYTKKLDDKITDWENEMSVLKGKSVIFFHASWIYFADRYNLKIAGYVEPKPGINPTPSHNAEIINLVKSKNIKVIVMENFYSDSAPNQIAHLTGARVVKVPSAVYGMTDVNTYIQMMDYIVNEMTKSI